MPIGPNPCIDSNNWLDGKQKEYMFCLTKKDLRRRTRLEKSVNWELGLC
jgi:hypothetical protein